MAGNGEEHLIIFCGNVEPAFISRLASRKSVVGKSVPTESIDWLVFLSQPRRR